jgi:transposase
MTTHKSEDYKVSSVNYYLNEDTTQEEVCKIFKCSPRSLMRWVDRFQEEEEIKRHSLKPIVYKIQKDQVNFILAELKKNKTITLDDLLVKLKEKNPTLTLSRFHSSRIVRNYNITLKITWTRHKPTKRFVKQLIQDLMV